VMAVVMALAGLSEVLTRAFGAPAVLAEALNTVEGVTAESRLVTHKP
jgi:hypothetical protein